jgi:hypothetical protein
VSASRHPAASGGSVQGRKVAVSENPYSPPRAEPEAEAKPAQSTTDGPRGLGGWLMLPLLGLLITPFRMGIELVRDFGPILKPEVWRALTTPGGDAYHPLWAPVIVFELATNVGIFGFSLVLLILFLTRSRRLPRLMVVWFLTIASVLVIDAFLVDAIPAAAAGRDAVVSDLIRTALTGAVWIPYFLRSERVKNTFVE